MSQTGSERTDTPSIATLIERRLSRRDLLKGAAAVTAAGALGAGAALRPRPAQAAGGLPFAELTKTMDETHHVAAGYQAQVLLRWGDPVVAGAPAFDPAAQSADAQEKQFGYNCDFVAFMPLPLGSGASDRGLLCVNHEYTIPPLMFPGFSADAVSAAQVETELAAHGHSVVEIRKAGDAWEVVLDSPYNRRLSLRSTEIAVSGPVAGHDRLKTKADPSGALVLGTLNNCAGGVTPWGTVLIAEENFHQYFSGDPAKTAEGANYKRVGIKGEPEYPWGSFVDRFDVEKEPNEPNRFGWIVELDPYEPASKPVKRTALGRFKHEAATCVVNKDGRVVVYSGDDERFDYVYRFVTGGKFDPANRAANMSLLDSGTLHVGRFDADGSLEWLPLVHGQGPLTEANGFKSQADILIETRRAADLLGATPMDRPEDVEPNPVTGRVYLVLTNNTKREPDKTDAANPRGPNKYGHVLEMIPPGGEGAAADHAADRFTWDIFIKCGDPKEVGHGASFHPDVSANGWPAAPDNCAFDSAGNIWIATDGAPGAAGFADGLYAAPVAGPDRALTKLFFLTPVGAELCGPCFTPDSQTLFLSVQHPGEAGDELSYDNPATRWPDFSDSLPPRPSIVVVTKSGGGAIGS
ncbi:MAG: PhoX family phosphatase [Alphaproteobacteria bacterium]